MKSRLLVVDDSALFRAAARDLFTAEGFEVVGVAVDGADAIDRVRRMQPDVVVLDVALPDTDGFAVAKRITGDDHAPHVVLVSSRDWGDLVERIRACGACGFIAKDLLSGAAITELIADSG